MNQFAGNKRIEVRLSGSGGQGIILAGIILAEAAGIHEGRYVSQTQVYGPEARGGAASSDVVVSDEPIDYPKAVRLDLLVAFNQQSYDAYKRLLKEEGILLVDPEMVKGAKGHNLYEVPFSRIAREEAGALQSANMVALGALSSITGLVSLEALEQAITLRSPKAFLEKNLKALRAGHACAQQMARGRKPF